MKKLLIIGVVALMTTNTVMANNNSVADQMEQFANSCLSIERQLKDSPSRQGNQTIHSKYMSCMSCRQTCFNLANTVRNVNSTTYANTQHAKCKNAMYQCKY